MLKILDRVQRQSYHDSVFLKTTPVYIGKISNIKKNIVEIIYLFHTLPCRTFLYVIKYVSYVVEMK